MKWWLRGMRKSHIEMRLVSLLDRSFLVRYKGNACFCDSCLLEYRRRRKRDAK